MIVIARKVENGATEYHLGEAIRKRHLFDGFHAEILGTEMRREGSGEAAQALNGARIRVYAKDLVPLPEKVDEVAAQTAPCIEDSHPWDDAASKELVKEVDIDIAELLVKAGHRYLQSTAGMPSVVDSPNMKTIALGMLMALAALAQKIEIESDAAVDFSKFQTFAIRDARLNSQNPSLNSELVRKRLDADIQKYLEAKGLTFVASGASDLNVRYTLGAVRRTELEAYPAGWRGWGTQIVRVPFTEGTLVIDLRDPSTRSLVWRAIAREDKSDASKIEGKLDAMVKKSLDKYPPKGK